MRFEQIVALADDLADFVLHGASASAVVHPTADLLHAKFAAAASAGDLDEAERLAHAVIDTDPVIVASTNSSQATSAAATADGQHPQQDTASTQPMVLLPFGELMLASAQLHAGHVAAASRLLTESLRSALEWNSDQCIAQVTWLQALAATQQGASLLLRDRLFRRAYERAPKGKSGAFQRVNCALALALIHASIPPSMTLSPIQHYTTEPSPVARALSHLTNARS